jgi:hypothetical protein
MISAILNEWEVSPERASDINDGHNPSFRASNVPALKGRNLLRPFRADLPEFITDTWLYHVLIYNALAGRHWKTDV